MLAGFLLAIYPTSQLLHDLALYVALFLGRYFTIYFFFQSTWSIFYKKSQIHDQMAFPYIWVNFGSGFEKKREKI